VGCGLAPTIEVLIVARIVQAAFGAVLVPAGLSIITASFEGAERGRAIGLWASGTSATAILGPLVGGFLVQAVSWRAAFLINVPLIGVALWASRDVEESRVPAATGRLDWLGAGAIAVAVGGLAFGATRGQERAWADPVAWAALGVGFVAAVAIPILMLTRPEPLVPPRLFSSRNFTVVNLSTLVIYGALCVTSLFQSLFLLPVPVTVPPGDARLFAARRRRGRCPVGDPAHLPVHPCRSALGARRPAAADIHWPGAHGRRTCMARPHSPRLGRVAGGPDGSG
jgi:MFS family permease